MTVCNIEQLVDVDRALADFDEYRQWGGIKDFDVWFARYGDDYLIERSATPAVGRV